MAHLVTGKRQTPENPAPSYQPYKLARTGDAGFHSNAPNPTNGHLYPPLPPLQTTFNVNLPPLTPDGVKALQERVTQLESQVSSLKAMFDRSSNSGHKSLPPPDQDAMLKELATVSASLLEAVPKPKPFSAFTAIANQPLPRIIPPTIPVPNPATQPVMATAPAPVPSSQPQVFIPPTQPVMTTANDPSLLPPQKTDFEKGNEFLAQKEYKKAITHYLKALAAKPSKASVLFNLGQCYRNTKEFPKAIDYYSKILLSENLYISARIKIASCYYDKEEYQQAIEILSKVQVRESDKKYDEFHAVFGDCHKLLQNPSKATEHYKKVSQNHTSFARIQWFLGYFHMNEPQTAIGFFREAIIFAGSDQTTLGHAHFSLGTIHLGQKDYTKARTHFTLVPKGHEKFDEAQEHLKQCNNNL